jgi:hypothetical protein
MYREGRSTTVSAKAGVSGYPGGGTGVTATHLNDLLVTWAMGSGWRQNLVGV